MQERNEGYVYLDAQLYYHLNGEYFRIDIDHYDTDDDFDDDSTVDDDDDVTADVTDEEYDSDSSGYESGY